MPQRDAGGGTTWTLRCAIAVGALAAIVALANVLTPPRVPYESESRATQVSSPQASASSPGRRNASIMQATPVQAPANPTAAPPAESRGPERQGGGELVPSAREPSAPGPARESTAPVDATMLDVQVRNSLPDTTVSFWVGADSAPGVNDAIGNAWSGPVHVLEGGRSLTLRVKALPAGEYYIVLVMEGAMRLGSMTGVCAARAFPGAVWEISRTGAAWNVTENHPS